MANYKVKNATGPWSAGQIITDDDLKAWPGGGGVDRLRDQLGAIEDTTEEQGQQPEDNTGHTQTPTKFKPNTVEVGPTGDVGPNAGSRRGAGGKS